MKSRTRSPYSVGYAISALGLLAFSAHASIFDRDGNYLPPEEVNSPSVNWALLSMKSSPQYNGVGVLEQSDDPKSPKTPLCSAAFIDTRGDRSSPAYALTAAHCAKLSPGSIVVSGEIKDLTFVMNYFEDARGSGLLIRAKHRRYEVAVKRVAYSSYKHSDVAILELNMSYQALVRKGFKPLPLETGVQAVGEKLSVIGVPMSDVDPKHMFLRRSDCSLARKINTRVNDKVHEAIAENAFQHDCSIVPGSSGAPTLSAKTGGIVGVLSSEPRRDWPDSVRAFIRYNITVPTDRVMSCFERGRFNLGHEGCSLEKPYTEGDSPKERCQEASAAVISEACLDAGERALQDGDPQMSQDFFGRGCRAGDLPSCTPYASARLDVDLEGALKLLDSVCSSGEGSACITLARLYWDGKRVQESFDKARALYKQACALSEREGCLKSGLLSPYD